MARAQNPNLAILDGRPELVIEIKKSQPGLILELTRRFTQLLQDNRFLEAVPGHIPTDAASQARVPMILEKMREIAGLH